MNEDFSAERGRLKGARVKAEKNLAEISTEEDAAITADAKADPDNPPADDLLRRQGRIR